MSSIIITFQTTRRSAEGRRVHAPLESRLAGLLFLSPPSDPVAKRIAGVIARQIKEMAPRVGVGCGISLKDDSGGGAGGHITRKMAMENQSNV